MEDELTVQRKQRAEMVDEFCAIFQQWADLAAEQGIISADLKPALMLPILKSSYLGRRLYGGEAHRVRPCPKHKGKWSGLPWEETECGCDLTGWLRQGFCVECKRHNGEDAEFCSKCGEAVDGE